MADGVSRPHSKPGRPESEWEPLEERLRQTAHLAAEFAAAFGAEPWGRAPGLWHDLGKYRADFHARLRGEPRQVDHAVVGALPAFEGLHARRASGDDPSSASRGANATCREERCFRHGDVLGRPRETAHDAQSRA